MNKLKAIIENLASRLGASKQGRVTPNDLIPFLPISLGLAEEHLREMVDDSVVVEGLMNGIQTFEFVEFLESEPKALESSTCLGCHEPWPDNLPGVCAACEKLMKAELLELAERLAWPAQAGKEHEFLFITASAPGPVTLASVAGRSRMTLKQLKEEFKDLARRKFARAVIDENHGVLTYEFPPIDYDADAYRRNDRFIRMHPSSLKEEVEVRIVRSLTAVAVILVSCILLGFFRFPFRLILPVGLIASLVAVFVVFTRKNRVEPEQI